MASEDNLNHVQSDVFDYARDIRDGASTAQASWNMYLATTEMGYGLETLDRLSWLDFVNRDAHDFLDNLEESDIETVDDPRDITGLMISPDNPYQAMREIDYGITRGDFEQDKLYVEPLEMAQEDFQKLYMKIVSNPRYSDIERHRHITEETDRRFDLQHDVYDTAEKLGFVSSELEELFDRIDSGNIEAARPKLKKFMSISYDYFESGIAILGDVQRYRRENNLDSTLSVENQKGKFEGPEEDGNPAIADVDTVPLNQEISEYIAVLKEINDAEIGLDPDPIRFMDDSELIGSLEEERDDETDSFWDEF